MKFLITAKSVSKDNIELTVASEDIDIFPRPITKVVSFNDTLTIEIPEIEEIKFLGLCSDCNNPVYNNERYNYQEGNRDAVICANCAKKRVALGIPPKPDKFCCQCGIALTGLYITTEEDGKFMCQRCFDANEKIIHCTKCGKSIRNIESVSSYASYFTTHACEKLCRDCYNIPTKGCFKCGGYFDDTEKKILHTDSHFYCRTCYNSLTKEVDEKSTEIPKCYQCGIPLPEAFNYANGRNFCNPCFYKKPVKPDGINHPSHYTQGKIEIIDFIEDQKLGYHDGNVIKYVCRARHKGTVLKDLKKAQWYLQRYIEIVQDVENADVAAERGG